MVVATQRLEAVVMRFRVGRPEVVDVGVLDCRVVVQLRAVLEAVDVDTLAVQPGPAMAESRFGLPIPSNSTSSIGVPVFPSEMRSMKKSDVNLKRQCGTQRCSRRLITAREKILFSITRPGVVIVVDLRSGAGKEEGSRTPVLDASEEPATGCNEAREPS